MTDVVSNLFPGMQVGIAIMIAIVAILIVIMTLVSCVVSIYLAIAYIRYNHKKNSAGLTGQEIARSILDKNGLQSIKVSAVGSIMFGNSYSHYFKKVRLRRFTYKKTSISAMAMATQKSALAILDKENDPDMIRRNRIIPFISFGPLAFIPLVLIGLALDTLIFNGTGVCAIICTIFGFLFYLYAFILSVTVLKVEKKAQERSLELMRDDEIANEEEITMAKKLFHLYNIEYINNMILALLELIYYALRIVALFANKGGSVSSSK